mgnify:FL=1
MKQKLRILPGHEIFKQGDSGNSAFLIISGSFVVIRNGLRVGKISEGEIFGELSLIIGDNRKATIKAITPAEIVEIKPTALNEILNSSLKLKEVIKSFSEELAKESNHKLPISLDELKKLLNNQPNVISSLALQLHHRLSNMIFF